ncbi:predicted protein [Nematostella vectensis]|uniref:PIH1D1/2/3 CS-like domain-containing protein n=1 Tax=Nematostella vectensis TaxID=45351 RepID=A7RVM5_NEMVE|nr:dynein axonemal assembly factor 6 [Nematostella vectensis]EDO44478.1 predicted protein [Nematostella vectensis]|eukprot:XP_001636541.1 predicted protein [Nematostella vectensis]
MEGIATQLTALSDLLKPPEDGDSSDDELEKPNRPKFTPGNIGPVKKTSRADPKENKVTTKDIWEPEEIPDSAHAEDEFDPRPSPEYDMVFKQAISPEEMFLQMGNRNPSSASCEEIVVKIKLPDTEYKDVDLDVTDTFLDCRTPKYKLGIHLPNPVDSKNGKAKWDKRTELLTVTLRLVREYDFLNF